MVSLSEPLQARHVRWLMAGGGVVFVVALALTTGGRSAHGAGSLALPGSPATPVSTSGGRAAPAASANVDPVASTVNRIPGEAHLDLGQSLIPLGDLLRHHQDVMLNGQHISFATSVVPEPVHDVLDEVEKGCAGDGSSPTNGAPKGFSLSNVHREETDGIGAVMCVPSSPELFAQAADAILHEGNMPKKWMPTHYTYAQPTTSGKTLVYSVWSEDPVDFDKLYTPTGDAPGTDPPGGMRPLGSRRLLSAVANGTDYTARVYETKDAVDAVTADYDTQMRRAGWTSSAAVAKQVPGTRIYTGKGRDLAVQFQPHENGTIIAMAEMPAEEP
jgi:hypothetical protein